MNEHWDVIIMKTMHARKQKYELSNLFDDDEERFTTANATSYWPMKIGSSKTIAESLLVGEMDHGFKLQCNEKHP